MYVRIGARRDKRPKSLKLEGKGRRPAGEGRLAVQSRSVRLGDLQRGQRAGLCGRLGPADQPQLLLETRYLRPLEIYLPIAAGNCIEL